MRNPQNSMVRALAQEDIKSQLEQAKQNERANAANDPAEEIPAGTDPKVDVPEQVPQTVLGDPSNPNPTSVAGQAQAADQAVAQNGVATVGQPKADVQPVDAPSTLQPGENAAATQQIGTPASAPVEEEETVSAVDQAVGKMFNEAREQVQKEQAELNPEAGGDVLGAAVTTPDNPAIPAQPAGSTDVQGQPESDLGTPAGVEKATEVQSGDTQPMPTGVVTGPAGMGDKLVSFFGGRDAQFIRALDGNASGAENFPALARASRDIFYDGDRALSVAEVRAKFEDNAAEVPANSDAAEVAADVAAQDAAVAGATEVPTGADTPAGTGEGSGEETAPAADGETVAPPAEDVVPETVVTDPVTGEPTPESQANEPPVETDGTGDTATPTPEAAAADAAAEDPGAEGQADAATTDVPPVDDTGADTPTIPPVEGGGEDVGTDQVPPEADPAATTTTEPTEDTPPASDETAAPAADTETPAGTDDVDTPTIPPVEGGEGTGDTATEPTDDVPPAEAAATGAEEQSADGQAAEPGSDDATPPDTTADNAEEPAESKTGEGTGEEASGAADPEAELSAAQAEASADAPSPDDAGTDLPPADDATPPVDDVPAADAGSDTTPAETEPPADESAPTPTDVTPTEGAPESANVGEIPEPGSEQAGADEAALDASQAAAASAEEPGQDPMLGSDTPAGAELPSADVANKEGPLNPDEVTTILNSDKSAEEIVQTLKEKGIEGSSTPGEAATSEPTPADPNAVPAPIDGTAAADAAAEIPGAGEGEDAGAAAGPDSDPASDPAVAQDGAPGDGVEVPESTVEQELEQNDMSLNEEAEVLSSKQQDMDETEQMIEEASGVSTRLGELAATVATTLDEQEEGDGTGEGMNQREAKLFELATEQLYESIGLKREPKMTQAFAMENFNDLGSRRQLTMEALEEVKDNIKRIVEAIIKAIKASIEWLSDMINQWLQRTGPMIKTVDRMLEASKAIPATASGEAVTDESIKRLMSIDGKPSVKPSDDVRQFATEMTFMIAEVAEWGEQTGKVVAQLLEDDGVATSAMKPIQIQGASETVNEVEKFGGVTEYSDVKRTSELLGGKAVFVFNVKNGAKISTRGADGKDADASPEALLLKRKALGVKFRNYLADEPKEVSGNLPTLNVGEARALLQEVKEMLTLIQNDRKKMDNIKRVKMSLKITADRVAARTGREKNTNKQSASDVALLSSAARSMDEPTAAVINHAFHIANAAMKWAGKSIENASKS